MQKVRQIRQGWRRRFGASLAATALVFTSLAACEYSPSRPSGCPSAQKVAGADSLTRFVGQSESTADIDFQARIYGVYTPRCQVQLPGPEATTGPYVADLQVEFMTKPRPDDLRQRWVSIGYSVVLVDPGGKTVSKDTRKITLLVTPDKAWASKIDTPSVVLPPSDRGNADGYRIYVSLELTARDLEYNRSHPERWP